jgi:flavin reductase (DIM6/NTAB) family NADH-FMN oxidoreductase RutF
VTDSDPASAPPNSRAFRRTVGQFATGVTVVATYGSNDIVGMTANAVTSVSLEPLLLLVCVDRRARIASHLPVGQPFSVNILRDDQEVLSRYFGGGWRNLPRPEYRFERWETAPRLVGSLAALRCIVDRVYDGGDHDIVIGRVVRLFDGPGAWNPLLFHAGRYRRLAPLAAPGAPPEEWGPDGVSVYYEEWGASPHDRAPKAGDGNGREEKR